MTDVDDNLSQEDNIPSGLETGDRRVDSENMTGMVPTTDNTMITNRSEDIIIDQTEDIAIIKDKSNCKRITGLVCLMILVPTIIVLLLFLNNNDWKFKQ
jgi:hypothetical protein